MSELFHVHWRSNLRVEVFQFEGFSTVMKQADIARERVVCAGERLEALIKLALRMGLLGHLARRHVGPLDGASPFGAPNNRRRVVRWLALIMRHSRVGGRRLASRLSGRLLRLASGQPRSYLRPWRRETRLLTLAGGRCAVSVGLKRAGETERPTGRARGGARTMAGRLVFGASPAPGRSFVPEAAHVDLVRATVVVCIWRL